MSPFFQYQAVSRGGDMADGSVTAANLTDARRKLRKLGMAVVSVEPGRAPAPKIPPLEILHEFLKSLSLLLRSGLPLLTALTAQAKRTRHTGLRAALLSMADAVESGRSLADSAHDSAVFPHSVIAALRVGEESGKLSDALSRVAQSIDEERQFRRKIEGLMFYPVMVLSMSMLVLTFLLTYVVPGLAEVLTQSDRPVPALTRFLIFTSTFLAEAGPYIGAALIVALLAGSAFMRSARGQEMKHRTIFRAGWARDILVARFFLSLSVLLESGLDLLKALDVCRDSAGNVALEDEIVHIRESVKRGRGLTSTMEESPTFENSPLEIVAAGESSGDLAASLASSGRYLQDRVALRLERTATLLEPLILVAVAFVVGLIVISILLPIADMSTSIR